MNRRDASLSPALVLALGGAAALVVIAIGIAASVALPALLAGGAVAGVILAGGVPAAAGIASWAVPAAAVGMAGAGAAGGYKLVMWIVHETTDKPLYGLSPLFGLLGGLATDFAVSTSDVSQYFGLIVGAIGGACVTGGMALFERRERSIRLTGVVLVAMPLVLLIWNVLQRQASADPNHPLPLIDPSAVPAIALLVVAMTGLGLLLFGLEREARRKARHGG